MRLQTRWDVPKPLSVIEVPFSHGASIAVRRHGNVDGPRLLLSHGNGLAIDLYYPFWSLLAARFDLIVYDLRNHGWNSLGELRSHNVQVFAEDHKRVVAAVDQQFGMKPKIGVYHSISALTAFISALNGVDFSALILFDLPSCGMDITLERLDAECDERCKSIRRRAAKFKSREEFAELLSFAPNLSRVVPGVRDLMARTTLRPSADGSGFVPRCPPEYEAQAVDYVGAWFALVDFESPPCPTKLIGADPALPSVHLPTLNLSEMQNVEYDFVPEATHLLQLEQPETCAERVLEFLDSHRLLESRA